MKRYLLGILMLLILFQPLASKALVNKVESYSSSAFSKEYIQDSRQELPATLFENFVLDVEDEDDLSELENHTSQETVDIQTSIPAHFYYIPNVDITLNSKHSRSECVSKPLYILWSVFLI